MPKLLERTRKKVQIRGYRLGGSLPIIEEEDPAEGRRKSEGRWQR